MLGKLKKGVCVQRNIPTRQNISSLLWLFVGVVWFSILLCFCFCLFFEGGVGGERGPLLCICFSFFSFLFFSVFQVFLQECLNHLISVEGKPSPDPKLRFEPGDLERKRF